MARGDTSQGENRGSVVRGDRNQGELNRGSVFRGDTNQGEEDMNGGLVVSGDTNQGEVVRGDRNQGE